VGASAGTVIGGVGRERISMPRHLTSSAAEAMDGPPLSSVAGTGAGAAIAASSSSGGGFNLAHSFDQALEEATIPNDYCVHCNDQIRWSSDYFAEDGQFYCSGCELRLRNDCSKLTMILIRNLGLELATLAFSHHLELGSGHRSPATATATATAKASASAKVKVKASASASASATASASASASVSSKAQPPTLPQLQPPPPPTAKVTAYFYYSREQSSIVGEELSGEGKDSSIGNITLLVSERFKALSESELAPYELRATVQTTNWSLLIKIEQS